MASPFTQGGSRHSEDDDNKFFSNALRQLEAINTPAALGITADLKTLQDDREVARWLGSDKMTLQSQYHSHLRELRTDDGCEFLLTHPHFANWYHATGSQRLVILGKIGSGKSVTMSFLIDQLIQRNEHQPRPMICYYYCRDDESGRAVNIFSALVLALLAQLSDLKKPFYEWYKENQASGVLEPATRTRKLEEFLEKVLKELDRPLFIVIDGLDKCDGPSRRAVLKLLRTLVQETQQSKILISSRSEEEILEQLEEADKIDISDTNRDTAIVRHKVETQLYYLSAEAQTLVINTLSSLAQGSAIWSEKTINLLETRRIQAIGPLTKFLKEMPLPDSS